MPSRAEIRAGIEKMLPEPQAVIAELARMPEERP